VELDMALTGCPVMYFHSGPPMHLLSGLDNIRRPLVDRDLGLLDRRRKL
jgi:hypothetical protein